MLLREPYMTELILSNRDKVSNKDSKKQTKTKRKDRRQKVSCRSRYKSTLVVQMKIVSQG